MHIRVDADACPVKEIIIQLAKQKNIPVDMYFDSAHVYADAYSTVHIVDTHPDAVDFALANDINAGDIVITQDYGLASMCLAKDAIVIHHNGHQYTKDNILSLLSQRAFNQKRRRHTRVKGPSKRTENDDQKFKKTLQRIIKTI